MRQPRVKGAVRSWTADRSLLAYGKAAAALSACLQKWAEFDRPASTALDHALGLARPNFGPLSPDSLDPVFLNRSNRR